MNKKGFTLIELLAVIVILAIIALIATPIVLNIIEDSKKSAKLNSANHYIDAVSNAIMKKNMSGVTFLPSECDIQSDGNLLCDGTHVEVEVNGETPVSGKIIFSVKNPTTGNSTAGNIKSAGLEFSEEYYFEMNEKGDLIEATKPIQVCRLAENGDRDKSGTVTPGDEYLCKVDPNKDEYTFYVLSLNEKDGTTNLIMEHNIYSDGTADKNYILHVTKESNPTQYNAVEWISQEDYNDSANYGEGGNTNKGPITAMNFLYNATKSWTNVPALNYTYNDKTGGYTSFVSTNGIATITSSTEPVVKTTIGTAAVPLRARMATSDDSNFDYYSNGGYLYVNLHLSGYWLLSTAENGELILPTHEQFGAAMIDDYGMYFTSASSTNGVRPVITVEI